MSNPKGPTMDQAVDAIGLLLLRSSQLSQLRFIEQTQGREFAKQVFQKAEQAGKMRKK